MSPAASIRRFTIADGMVLVAGMAAGSVLIRAAWPGIVRIVRVFGGQLGPGLGAVEVVGWWVDEVGSCVVVPLMLATITAGLRRPRPRWRRLTVQPGMAACLACAVSLAPGLAWMLASGHRPGFQQPDGFRDAWLSITFWTRTAAPGAWLMLWVSGLWRPAVSWVDRLGRALGGFWVLLWIFQVVLVLAQRLYRL